MRNCDKKKIKYPHIIVFCTRQEVVDDVISSQDAKHFKAYHVVNFEIAATGCFHKSEIRHLCDALTTLDTHIRGQGAKMSSNVHHMNEALESPFPK